MFNTKSAHRDEVERFQLRLAETIAWCSPRGSRLNPRGGLRSPLLRPLDADEDDGRLVDAPEEWHDIVETLTATRRALLGGNRISQNIMLSAFEHVERDALAGGALLAFDPDHSLSDGAAWVANAGFFDCVNSPAWDTWIYHVLGPENGGNHPFNSYLLSWVPPYFLNLAEEAIDANPEGCILLAANLDRPFIRSLRAAGLLA
jgi:hypothetical protein